MKIENILELLKQARNFLTESEKAIKDGKNNFEILDRYTHTAVELLRKAQEKLWGNRK